MNNAEKQGLWVVVSGMVRDAVRFVTGGKPVHTIEIPARSVRRYDLVQDFGGDRVTDVFVNGGTTTLWMTGVNYDNPWAVDVPSDRVLEVRPVTRGRDKPRGYTDL